MSDGLIAIIGASCRFPGADGIEAYWRLLSEGTDAVRRIDDERWSTRFFYHPSRGAVGKSYTWAAGLIDGVDRFEPAFFGISPREAAQMDPQQRLMLELAWHAVEDAGIPASRFAGTETGVFVGASSTDYRDVRIGDPSSSDSYSMTGGTLSIIANRVSYVFDLRGPSFTVDTACSSSLVALHQACEAIRAGRIAAAIVGGVNILLSPFSYVGFCRAAMLSPTGHCYAFDERADGYVRSEGGGALVLKPLAQAIADGDPIRAVIRGTGVNSDGRTIGLSLPNEAAQAGLLRALYAGAGVAPDDLAFFEMHGTGTPAGDPIEAAAVGAALGQRRSRKLPIGSVKSNLGHLEPASGMAGVIKAALALEHGLIPPSVNCETPNPKIPFDELNLRVLQRAERLTEGSCVGVNSFGFGGTNGHAILAAAPRRKPSRDTGDTLPPLVISARSEASLRHLVTEWRAAELTPARLRAAAHNRDQHPHRLVALGGAGEIAAALDGFLADPTSSDAITGTALREGQLAFVFSGNGAQFAGMGCDAYRNSAGFRAAIDEVDALFRPLLGWSAADFLRDGIDAERLARADYAQPLLFAIQVGIVTVLRQLGVAATGHIGHSVGEVAAAWAARALSLADAVRVIVARSRNQEQTRGIGRMAAVAAGGDAVRELLAEMGSPVELAAVNAAQSVTVSGPEEAIEQLRKEGRRRGVACRALDLDFAFHSRAMDPIREPLCADLAGLVSTAPETMLVSTVTGDPVGAGQLGAGYWWQNVRRPVQFVDAMARLVAAGHRIFVEIGASSVLQSYLHDALRAGEVQGRVLATLAKKESGADPFPAIAARCHVAGHDLTEAPWFDGPADPRGLPLYPWQRERFWYETTVEGPDLVNPQFLHPLLGFRGPGPLPSWINHLDQDVLPWLADHAIEGVPVLPAAAVVEMALAAARFRRPDAIAIEVADVELRRPLPFDKGQAREIRTRLDADDGEWELSSRPRLSEEAPTIHAVARAVSAVEAQGAPAALPGGPPGRIVDAAALYRLAAGLGLDYGPNFQTVSRIAVMAPDEAVVDLDPGAIAPPLDLYLIHPALLDGALQGLLALIAEAQPGLRGVSFLPWRFGRVRLSAPFARVPRRAHLKVTRLGTRSAAADIALFDANGAVIAELSECWFRRVELTRGTAIDERALRVDLVPAPLDSADNDFTELAEALPALAASHAGDRERGAEQALLLDALVAAVSCAAIRELPGVDAGFQPDRVAPEAARLLEAQLRLLARFGAAEHANGEWRLAAENDLPEANDVWRLLLAESPDLVGELGLVASIAEDLPRRFAEGRRGGEATVPDPLDASPVTEAGIGFVRDALGRIAETWPAHRPLRVLEIAAGGMATRRLLDRLAQSGVALSYTAANADLDALARLGFITEAVTGATACCWSPVKGDDTFAPASFDIVLSVNGVAHQPVDADGLVLLGELTAPGGLFLAVEPQPSPLWDLAFDGAALRSKEEWHAALAVAGFAMPENRTLCLGPWPSVALWAHAAATASPAREPARGPAIAIAGGAAPLGRALEKLGYRIAEDSEIAVFAVEGAGDAVGYVARAITALARVAADCAQRRRPLWVVTQGAQQATTVELAGAALWGFGRVLVNEMPGLDVHLLDLPPDTAPQQRAERLDAELAAGSTDSEIVWTLAGRHVLRLRRGLPPRWATPDDTLALAGTQPGRLDALAWSPAAPLPPGPGEIGIDVAAAALNFRDVMWGMGLLPEEALIDGFAGPSFGLECAGVISAIGPEVEGLAVGDRVVGFAPAALATRVTTLAHAVVPIPPGLDFAAAATAPVAFVTAFYALGTLGRLATGETVLIHAAAGGVGLAAIQVAKHKGASVIATAGSPAKRAFLRRAGADHVLDSRDLGFADAVRSITGGAGVDVVLNSLSGEAMENSIAVLKPFGRFLELGKRDFYQNRRIHLRPFRQNVSYFAIDVDQLPTQRPDLAQALLAETAAALAEGTIRPLAHRVFPFAEIDDAFRLMQASGHVGKLVLVPRGNAAVRLPPPPAQSLPSDGVYLVTGGLSGFGFEAARWLVQSGARSLALLGRRGADTPGAAERVAKLTALGADIRIYAGDVAERASLGPVLAQIRARQGRLRGVVHAASAIGDGLAADIEAEAAAAILKPKLAGAIALDELTRDDPIELFMLFSSATTLLGAPGQGVYVAANMTLEALARRRRAEGRPALAVGWGPIADAGYLADRPDTRDTLARRLGAKPIPAAEALAALPALAASSLPFAAFAETSWSEALRYLPILATSLFAEIRAEASALSSDDSLAERLAALDGDEALTLLKGVVTEEAANILRLPVAGIDAQRPLSELGMDSLMAVELRLALESRLRIDLPLVSLAEGTSVVSIAGRLAGAVAARPRHDEVLTLAARYEIGESAELAALADDFEPADERSAAAE